MCTQKGNGSGMFQEIQNIHEDCNELFICLPEFKSLSPNSVRLAGISELRTLYQIGRVANQTHLLLFTRNGYGRLKTADGEFEISPQTLTVLPAGKGFYFELASQEWQTCWFILKDSQQWKGINQMPQEVFHCREVNVVHSTLKLLHQQHELEGSGKSAMESELMDILFRYLKLALGNRQSVSDADSRIWDFITQLSGRLHIRWTTEKIAEELHLSEPHLFRLFKANVGKSPMQYLTELRIQHASELLKHSNLSIEQIALCVGYNDGTSFSHRFRKAVGASPGIWRQNQH